MMRLLSLLTALLLVALLVACAPETSTPISFIPLASSPVPCEETCTPLPSRTPTITSTPTPMPSATPTPYENIDFSQVEIGFGGFLPGWRYFITFDFPQAVSGSYFAVVDRNKPYTCEVRSSAPNRLYCNGPLSAIYNWASVELYALEETDYSAPEAATQIAVQAVEPLMTGEFFVPLMDD